MKKTLLLLIGLTIISCSSDDDTRTTDPIIGTWLEDEGDGNLSTFVFNSNYSFTENSNDFSITGSWENDAEVNEENFELLNQRYWLDGIGPSDVAAGSSSDISFLFSGDFSSYTITTDKGERTYRRQDINNDGWS